MAQYSDFKTTGQLSKLQHLIYIKDKKNSIRLTREDDTTGKRYVYFVLPLDKKVRVNVAEDVRLATKQVDGQLEIESKDSNDVFVFPPKDDWSETLADKMRKGFNYIKGPSIFMALITIFFVWQGFNAIEDYLVKFHIVGLQTDFFASISSSMLIWLMAKTWFVLGIFLSMWVGISFMVSFYLKSQQKPLRKMFAFFAVGFVGSFVVLFLMLYCTHILVFLCLAILIGIAGIVWLMGWVRYADMKNPPMLFMLFSSMLYSIVMALFISMPYSSVHGYVGHNWICSILMALSVSLVLSVSIGFIYCFQRLGEKESGEKSWLSSVVILCACMFLIVFVVSAEDAYPYLNIILGSGMGRMYEPLNLSADLKNIIGDRLCAPGEDRKKNDCFATTKIDGKEHVIAWLRLKTNHYIAIAPSNTSDKSFVLEESKKGLVLYRIADKKRRYLDADHLPES